MSKTDELPSSSIRQTAFGALSVETLNPFAETPPPDRNAVLYAEMTVELLPVTALASTISSIRVTMQASLVIVHPFRAFPRPGRD